MHTRTIRVAIVFDPARVNHSMKNTLFKQFKGCLHEFAEKLNL